MTSPHQQFESASVRHKGKPPVFDYTYWPVDAEEAVTVSLRINPMADMMRVASAFTSFGEGLKKMGDATADPEEVERSIEVQLPRVRKGMRGLLVPPDRDVWDQIAEDVAITDLSKMVAWAMSELSGLDPTQLPQSPGPSSPDGESSTDGALPVESTPPPSLTAEP